MQSTKSPLTFKALNGLGSGCHGDMISAIWRTVFELRQGLESMAPERSQQGIINEMFSAVMPPCWPTDRAFFAATWKDSGSCRFCLDRVSQHFYFCSSLNSDWSFSRMHYLYMGTPIQIRWRGGVNVFRSCRWGFSNYYEHWGLRFYRGCREMWAPKCVHSFGKESHLQSLNYPWTKFFSDSRSCMGWRHFLLYWIMSETLLVVWPSTQHAKSVGGGMLREQPTCHAAPSQHCCLAEVSRFQDHLSSIKFHHDI